MTPYKIRHLPTDRLIVESLEIADTARLRRRGLLGRTELPAGGGMLFPGTSMIHTFGMAFPIDVVFLDSELGVRTTSRNLGARRLCGSFLAAYCLELPGGTLDRFPIAPGDLLRIEKHVGEPAEDSARTG